MALEIHRAAFKTLQSFPDDVLREAKEAFAFLERGEKLSMPLSRPMPAVWLGCHELRIGNRQGTYRIFYVMVVKGALFIPHCFKKKTQKTPQSEIELAKRRIKEHLNGK
jgi:phage-related protein